MQHIRPEPTGMETQDVLQLRKAHYGPNTSLNYDQPLHIVKGRGCYLYDANGREYLDCVNNVTHLGHGRQEVCIKCALLMPASYQVFDLSTC